MHQLIKGGKLNLKYNLIWFNYYIYLNRGCVVKH